MLFAGHYQLLEKIGRGGMASVYKAKDLENDALVAIKILRLDGQDELIRTRFFSELLLTSSVRHPHIVSILDFGVSGPLRRPFLVMDLMVGSDLSALLSDRGPIPAPRLLRLFDGVLDALATVHARGIIHKDIKPSNLFLQLQPDGAERMVLMDFGVAHSLDLRRSTDPSLLACTPHYGAPEYFLHQEVTPALDVYQIMLVLIEALLGWHLVDEPHLLACINAHVQGKLRIPPALYMSPIAPILRRGLAIEATQRYPSAAELLYALRQLDPQALEMSLGMLRQIDGFDPRSP